VNDQEAPPDQLPLEVDVRPNPGLSAGQQRVIALFEIVLCSSVPTQLIIGRFMLAAGWSFVPVPTLSTIVVLSVADTVVLIALMVILTHAHGEGFRTLWLGSRRILPEAGLGLLLVPAVFVIVGVLMTLLMRLVPVLHNVPTNPLEQLATGGAHDAVLLGVVAILAGGVREELQRAFLLQRFERHLGGTVVGVIVLSTAFGLGHLLQGRDAAVTTGVLGAFWAIAYVRRRSAVAPMVSHAGFNALEVLRVALIS
jgi:membrane protease YdiL (CAAX protease family)